MDVAAVAVGLLGEGSRALALACWCPVKPGWASRWPIAATRSPAARSPLNTLQMAATGERYVRSEEELLYAIGEIAARFDAILFGDVALLTAGGGKIVLADAFTLSAKVVIPPKCVLLTIEALPGAMLLPSVADQGVVFEVQAPSVTFRNVWAYASTKNGEISYFNTFIEAIDSGESYLGAGLNPRTIRAIDCVALCDRLFVDSSAGTADNAYLSGCTVNAPNATHDACVVFASKHCAVVDCSLDDGGGDTVTIDAGAEYCRVNGSDLDGGDVTSTASDGSNVIMGNLRTGTLTLHTTDARGLNT